MQKGRDVIPHGFSTIHYVETASSMLRGIPGIVMKDYKVQVLYTACA